MFRPPILVLIIPGAIFQEIIGILKILFKRVTHLGPKLHVKPI